jgi:hypothetical protein
MAMTFTTPNTQDFGNFSGCGGGGIGRMSDEDYETEFKFDAAASDAAVRTFSQAAKEYAAKNKQRIRTKSQYRMGANSLVKNAFNELEERLIKQRTTATSAETAAAVMSQADFQLLKQGIENFHVQIVVHDNLTLAELKDMREECSAEQDDMRKEHDDAISMAMLAAATTSFETDADAADSVDVALSHASVIQHLKEAHDNLDYWVKELSAEIRRIQNSKEVPSQQAEISRSSGVTLQNILSESTIRRRFISLNTLTKTIRSELKNFITDESRHKDRATVVEQIKQCCRSSRKQKCGE